MTELISASALSELIGSIYDCALDPGLWSATLTSLRDLLGFHNAALTLVGLPKGEVLLTVTSGIESSWLERIPLYGADIVEQWGGADAIHAIPFEEPAVLSLVNPNAYGPASKNRFYLEWEKPQCLNDNLAIGLVRDSMTVGSVGFGRHEQAGPIGEREVALARLFIPHLQRAAAISRLLDIKTVVAASFEATLDNLQTPIILANSSLQLVHANQSAKDMLALGDPLQLKSNILTSRSKGLSAALTVAVAQACADESALGRKGMGIPGRMFDGTPCALYVLPLRHGKLRPGITPDAVVAIFMAPTMTPIRAPKEVIAALFDLTVTEAEVLEHIASGLTSSQTANLLEVELSTIKTHLIRLFEKMGVHRQADLIALAASFAAPIK